MRIIYIVVQSLSSTEDSAMGYGNSVDSSDVNVRDCPNATFLPASLMLPFSYCVLRAITISKVRSAGASQETPRTVKGASTAPMKYRARRLSRRWAYRNCDFFGSAMKERMAASYREVKTCDMVASSWLSKVTQYDMAVDRLLSNYPERIKTEGNNGRGCLLEAGLVLPIQSWIKAAQPDSSRTVLLRACVKTHALAQCGRPIVPFFPYIAPARHIMLAEALNSTSVVAVAAPYLFRTALVLLSSFLSPCRVGFHAPSFLRSR